MAPHRSDAGTMDFDPFAFALSPDEARAAVQRFLSHYPPLGPALDRLAQTGKDVLDANGATPGDGSTDGLRTD